MAVIDSDVFDALFRMNLQRNAEGEILGAREFAAHVIDRTVTGEPVQAAGAALSGSPGAIARRWAGSYADPGDVIASCMQRRLLGRYALEPTCEAPDGDERWL